MSFSKSFTFQNFSIPPPKLSDQEYLKTFESKIVTPKPKKIVNKQHIRCLRVQLASLCSSLRDIEAQERFLSNNQGLTDEDWKSALENLENNKGVIEQTILKMSGSFLEVQRKYLTRRAAKRRRLKRRREEVKEKKKLLVKQREENSRKIDENLQKIQEDIQKAKQEEEAKQQSDIVLKEVLRKKHDAKKSIAKLEALLKLRHARENTAKGKGQSLPDSDVAAFQDHIEKLKSLWIFKLSIYEVEETQLRSKLEVDKKDNASVTERKVVRNLAKWQKLMFGCKEFPQVDFKGDVGKFIAVRSQWDEYICNGPESTPIPLGWAVPTTK